MQAFLDEPLTLSPEEQTGLNVARWTELIDLYLKGRVPLRRLVLLIDARHIEAGPVCRIALPHNLCSGTHSSWADRAYIRNGRV